MPRALRSDFAGIRHFCISPSTSGNMQYHRNRALKENRKFFSLNILAAVLPLDGANCLISLLSNLSNSPCNSHLVWKFDVPTFH